MDQLAYDTTHQVIVCKWCRTCVAPGRAATERHFRRKSTHGLVGPTLRAYVEYADSFLLRPLNELKAKRGTAMAPVQHLNVLDGFRCLGCAYSNGADEFLTTHLPRMRDHVATHGKKAGQHTVGVPLWEDCELQSYFGARGRIDYFLVQRGEAAQGGERGDSEGEGGDSSLARCTVRHREGDRESKRAGDKRGDDVGFGETHSVKGQAAAGVEEERLFGRLEGDMTAAALQLADQGEHGVAKDFDLKTSRVPWLERTGFPSHLAGLSDKEVKSSYRLPNKGTAGVCSSGGVDDDNVECNLLRIDSAAVSVLQDAYKLCSDTSPERKMTQQRANILSEFYAGASGRSAGFRYYKDPSTLNKYFGTFRQLLAYYFRVVHFDGEHFTRTQSNQVLPGEAIRPTSSQKQAGEEIVAALRSNDEEALQRAIRRLYLALICHTVGSTPYESAVLSFCAMLSRRGGGLWEEPGNFNSKLSALIWTAQMLIFDQACFYEQNDDKQIPVFLKTICQAYFQQLAETPFGHILQWRLYLFKVGKAAITKHQARWSLDGQSVEYRGLELQMSQVSGLVVSEYRQAHALLYDELMFGTSNLVPMQGWRLRDDLDADGFGHSWLNHPSNIGVLEGAKLTVLESIRARVELRTMFVAEWLAGDGSGPGLSDKAIAIYEASAQDFLERLVVLCHITSGQPLREPELLCVTWRNTEKPRHIFIWQRLVMIYTQYHKGQQQSGIHKNNARFLPKAVGDLLLDYIAYVLPLRQLFLRQKTPHALITPYLWAKSDGSPWPDGTLSRCLSKACARAQVPRLHTANWRQISTSICKEKFSARERAHFHLDGDTAAEIAAFSEDEEEEERGLIAMAEQSNHSYHTFNRAYAGSSMLTMNSVLHRGYRASKSWRALFCFDQIMDRKRPRAADLDAAEPMQMLLAAKRRRLRKRASYLEADFTAVARRLLGAPGMKLRVPGQRDGLLAIMGPHAAEQVVLVLGTGSGKSLTFMVGAAMADAQTTILILPMVALRRDMLRRCLEMGIRPLVWSVDCSDTARLVIVSAEAACSSSFLEYAQRLVGRQKLDRVVVDECHLTVTTGDYRPHMSQLGWYVRQLRTQTVWLTATLPPSMEEEFTEHNKLVRPRIVRESTNRPNIKYLVSYEVGPDTLGERAVELVRAYWPRREIFNHSRDKIIIYCRTRDEVGTLAGLLACPSYTSRSGDEEERASIIAGWLANVQQPVIVATSALGVGFDHPFVRWVIHVGAPDGLINFSQESGRAGRDGSKATSIVLLHAGWKPDLSPNLAQDKEAMQLYLTTKHCSRGVLSQFLDAPSDWRWCMLGEQPCQVCNEPHEEGRPAGVVFALTAAVPMHFTGPAEVLRQDHVRDEALDSYEKDLEIMIGSCLYCRVGHRKFDHMPDACSRRFEWIRAKETAYQTRRKEGKEWIGRYVVCWRCYQPQDICRVADPEHEERVCRFPDIVMPLCHAVYHRVGGKDWIRRHFGRLFEGGIEEYMLWLGEKASLKGTKCIQANCVAAAVMQEL